MWQAIKCFFGFHVLFTSVNAKYDQCAMCWKLFKVV